MEIRSEFQVHLLNETGVAKAKQLAEIFTKALTEIEGVIGGSWPGAGSREGAIVRTKMEEASFFAKKAMASMGENQKDPEPQGAIEYDAPKPRRD